VIRTPVIRFFNNKYAVPSCRQIFGGNSTSTPTTHNDYVCLDNFWLVTRWELNEVVLITFTAFHTSRNARNTEHTAQRWGDFDPCLLSEDGQGAMQLAYGAQSRNRPALDNSFPYIGWLLTNR
jgi:hypothetical protein